MPLLITVLILLLSSLLIIVILAQNSKGGGLSSQFGGSGASNMIGVKKTSDLLEKLTWGFAIGIITLSVLGNLNFMKPQNTGTDFSDRLQDTPNTEAIPSELGDDATITPFDQEGTSSDSSGN